MTRAVVPLSIMNESTKHPRHGKRASSSRWLIRIRCPPAIVAMRGLVVLSQGVVCGSQTRTLKCGGRADHEFVCDGADISGESLRTPRRSAPGAP
eukprot:scaffold285645_cov29-Tisochrysis_lutea.AAC.2